MDQNYFKLLEILKDKVSKDELMHEGFESLYGNKQIRPPSMDYAHGDFRTINVGWIPPQYYTKTSHYLLQVSDNNVDWRGLRFDGQDFGYDIGTVTTVFSSNIAHTRIPFLNGGIRILYYRAATVSKDGEISEWSNSIVGNTFFVEQSDIRGTDYIYPLQGTIQLSSEFDTGQFSYIAEGGMTISGAATWDGWFDYIAYNGTGEIKLTSSFQNEQEVDIVEVGSGIIQTGALTWKEVVVKYYLIENNMSYGIALSDVVSERNGTPHTVVITANTGWCKHYAPLTGQMIALEAANKVDITLYSEDYF